jgi:hypothetical protein
MRRSLAVVTLVVVLATGCQFVGSAGPYTSFHGDSMGAQADRQIADRLTRSYRLFRYSQERAVVATMIPVIDRMMRGSPRPQIVIVELGAGDANEFHGDARMRRDIRRVLDLVDSVPCVRWLNLKIAGVNGFYRGYVARADDFNRILAREVDRHPNAEVAPYRRWAEANPDAFKADGLHHTRRGKLAYARYIESVAATC